MMAATVTNEFTHMNAGMERRPFKVLTPPERSTAMVIARYTNRQPAFRAPARAQDPSPDLLWKAVRLGCMCAACAFAFFFVSQRNLFERNGETLGPAPESIQRLHFEGTPPQPNTPTPQPAEAMPQADGKSISPSESMGPQGFSVPEARNLAITEFNLSVTPEFQSVASVELRLTGVNASANTYDIFVKTNQREFYRQDVKLNEHIPLAKYSAHGPELVVGAISQNRVFGYLSEPQHRGHRRHHRRS
jgi:hypothetical protein